jgi:hypothetical protein
MNTFGIACRARAHTHIHTISHMRTRACFTGSKHLAFTHLMTPSAYSIVWHTFTCVWLPAFSDWALLCVCVFANYSTVWFHISISGVNRTVCHLVRLKALTDSLSVTARVSVTADAYVHVLLTMYSPYMYVFLVCLWLTSHTWGRIAYLRVHFPSPFKGWKYSLVRFFNVPVFRA